MASTVEAEETARISFPNEIRPLKSQLLTTVLGMAVGVSSGFLVTWGWSWLFNVDLSNAPLPSYIPFLLGALPAAVTFFKNCTSGAIETGWVGVPTFQGTRERRFPIGARKKPQKEVRSNGETTSLPTEAYVLSEGNPVLPPGFDYKPVDVRRDTSEPRNIVLLSEDGIPMRVRLVFEREVVDPFIWLDNKDPDGSIYEIAEAVARDAFSCHQSKKLVTVDVKKHLACDMKRTVDEDDHKYGLNVTKFFEPEVLPPEEIVNELMKIQMELLQAQSEGREIETVRELVKKLVDEDKIPVGLAYEFVQAERGKAATTRQTLRLEGLDELLGVLRSALALIRNNQTGNRPKKGKV